MRWFLTTLFLAVVAASASAQERKYALLVGVKRYDGKTFVQLPSAEKDALALDQTLKSLGFHLVITMTNEADLPTRRPSSSRKILDQLDLMLKGKERDDTVLVFLSGHGIQLKNDPVDSTGNKETYFCPEEAKVRDKTSLVAIGEVMKRLSACPANRKLLLIDSCREEMLAEEAAEKSGGTIELEPVQVKRPPPPAGLAVLFSCSPGETSHAFKKLGDQGAFTHFTLKYLKGEADAGRYRKGELLTSELAAYVARETNDYVIDQLGKQQVPEFLAPGGLRPWPLGKLLTRGGITEGSRAGEIRTFTDLGVKFCWCPAGSFRMGSPPTEELREDNESQVDVTLTRGFWLGQTEVTQGQWESVMGTKPWSGTDNVREGGTYPAVEIRHGLGAASEVEKESAVAFCRRLTARERSASRLSSGWSYRLPSEAEWEYACRAGTRTVYSFGEDHADVDQYGWYRGITGGVGEAYPHQVGLKKPNAWGLHDMYGNVWEWCGDWYGEKLPGGSDPRGPASGSNRVMRGGSFCDSPMAFRSAYRTWGDGSSEWLECVGFRVVLSPSGE